MTRYAEKGIQLAVIADGQYQKFLLDLVRTHHLHRRVAVRNYDEELSHLAYAASDFVLMPSAFEPCGLPQMIGPIYGCLPIAHDTGGIHDTVEPLKVERNAGNGFLFEVYDSTGLLWAISETMNFFEQPADLKRQVIERIMHESAKRYSPAAMAAQYLRLYEEMLRGSLIRRCVQENHYHVIHWP
jgi:starch synthase